MICSKDRWSVVDSQQVVQGTGLEAEVVVVKLSDESELLVEVTASANLKPPAGRQIVVSATGGYTEASATKKGVLG